MHIGMVGLGRMGSNMVRRLIRAGHSCVVYDRSPDAIGTLVKEGAAGAHALAEFVQQLPAPRIICLMVPVATVDARGELPPDAPSKCGAAAPVPRLRVARQTKVGIGE